MNPAQKCREEKQLHPERYCPKCLWNVARSGPCRTHGSPKVIVALCVWCDEPILAGEPSIPVNNQKCHATCLGELNAYDVEEGAWRDDEDDL